MRQLLGLVIVLGMLAFWVWETLNEQPDHQGYYVLALSWTPSWCALEGDARNDARCDTGAGKGWLVHGLWPQSEDGGWPEFCATQARGPSAADLTQMLPVMGSEGLARHQWNKHGTCSGLGAAQYFAQTRAAFAAFDLPDLQQEFTRGRASPAQVLAALQARNPALGADMAIVTCRSGDVQEVRVCLDDTLQPRACDAQLLSRACQRRDMSIPAIR